MEKLSFTLYEVFGYFLPGVVGITAISILFWAIFWPTTPVPVQNVELSKLWYFILVVVSYYCGHVLQDISRSWFKNPDESVLDKPKSDLLPIVQCARQKIAAALDVNPSEGLSGSALVRVSDEVALQYGQPGDRDVFVYREGFYRGSIAAFLLLDVALLVRCIVPGSALRLPPPNSDVSRGQLIFLMSVVSCGLFFLARRYRHFAALRVMRGILAFVSLSCFPGPGREAEETNTRQAGVGS